MLTSLGKEVLIKGITAECDSIPLYRVHLDCKYVIGPVAVGLVTTLPIDGVDLLLGNDIVGNKVYAVPIVLSKPETDHETEKLETLYPGIFPECAMTRSQTKAMNREASISPSTEESNISSVNDGNIALSNTFLVDLNSGGEEPTYPNEAEFKADKKTLILKQKEYCSLSKLYTRAFSEKLPICFYLHDGVLMRKWRPCDVPVSDHWQVSEQNVVPKEYRLDIMNLAHDIPLTGHLGV
ncbi:Hypothetical predicted protein [Octopus vulgaris]|uniref:Uncharacterized protein n=1 Tax=Octopus vulgaris TaxID=6645 RepID=A0AA36BB28_OCTVU|nr:Hypothetical predicted protein [Octopus vulgaris]